ncbi:hypothetical protein [Streptomyces sp. NPDC001816]
MGKFSRPENMFTGFDTARYGSPARAQWPAQAQQSAQFAATLSS